MKLDEKRHISFKKFHRTWLNESHDLGAFVEEYDNVLIIVIDIDIVA